MNIAIVRTFVLLRQYALEYKDLSEKIKKLEQKHNKNYKQVFDALKELLLQKQQLEEFTKRKRIGFKPD